MKPTEVRDKSTEELERMRRDLKQEHFNLRIQQRTGQLEKTNLLREIRRDVARVNTTLAERRRETEATS